MNDFTLPDLGGIALVTGSNMSGKSTFLRTIGAALVLAFAGSPVPAQRMRTLPFRLFTSMNVADSINDGISFFYAEVRRLKALLDALEADHAYPLLFLIDEIFRGTNNRERQIGSWAYTRALVGRNGAGFLSTHDLELANLASENPSIKNYHFKETIQDGKMVFDFKIHPGASPTTNALRIMALAGLPLPPEKKEA
jgi:DNA mismatch repair ATPase MutS